MKRHLRMLSISKVSRWRRKTADPPKQKRWRKAN